MMAKDKEQKEGDGSCYLTDAPSSFKRQLIEEVEEADDSNSQHLVTTQWILMPGPLEHLYLALRTTQQRRHGALHFTSEGLRLIEVTDLPQVAQLLGSRGGICTEAAGYLCAGLSDGHTGAMLIGRRLV